MIKELKEMKNTSSSGTGFFGVLQIVFVVLKLVGAIDWSWWWVLSPIWIGLIIDLLIMIAIYEVSSEKKIKRGNDKWKF